MRILLNVWHFFRVMADIPNTFNPGQLEVYSGPMFSDKTYHLISRMRHAEILNIPGIIFKPVGDTRTPGQIYSRWGGGIYLPAIEIPDEHPQEVMKHLEDILKSGKECMVGFDEVGLYNDKIVPVISSLMDHKYLGVPKINIVVVGLNKYFNGEPFGSMSALMSMADVLVPLRAICDYIIKDDCSGEEHKCRQWATRTQRLLNGKPAPYDDPLKIIEGDKKNRTYHPRCSGHHEVPGKPLYEYDI
jgi:thymidine kinase